MTIPAAITVAAAGMLVTLAGLQQSEVRWTAAGACASYGDDSGSVILLEFPARADDFDGFSLAIRSGVDLSLERRVRVATELAIASELVVDTEQKIAYLTTPSGSSLTVVRLEDGSCGIVSLLDQELAPKSSLRSLQLVPDLDGDGTADILIAIRDRDRGHSTVFTVGSHKRAILAASDVAGSIDSIALLGNEGAVLVWLGDTSAVYKLAIEQNRLLLSDVVFETVGRFGKVALLPPRSPNAHPELLFGRFEKVERACSQLLLERRDFEDGSLLASRVVSAEVGAPWSLTCRDFPNGPVVALAMDEWKANQERMLLLSGNQLQLVGELHGDRLGGHFGSGVLLRERLGKFDGLCVANFMFIATGTYAVRFILDLDEQSLKVLDTIREEW
ncbi:MAG: hypothetical protein ACI835_001006 [Planctomycetota bacterium]|jgi:hypothetical protein